MEHLHLRKKGRLLSIIVPNQGAIDNLPNDSIVETAGLLADGSVTGERIGALPLAFASLVRREQDIQELVVAAWAESSRDLVLQALLDRMLTLQAEYLPPLE